MMGLEVIWGGRVGTGEVGGPGDTLSTSQKPIRRSRTFSRIKGSPFGVQSLRCVRPMLFFTGGRG